MFDFSSNSKVAFASIEFFQVHSTHPMILLNGADISLKHITQQHPENGYITGLISCVQPGGSIQLTDSTFSSAIVTGSEPLIGASLAFRSVISRCSFLNVTNAQDFHFTPSSSDTISLSSSTFLGCENVFYGPLLSTVGVRQFHSKNNTYVRSLTTYSPAAASYTETKNITDQTDASFTEDIFTSCVSTASGGALCKLSSGTLSLHTCAFGHCSATGPSSSGGAVAAGVLGDASCAFFAEYTTFANCSAALSGGAVWAVGRVRVKNGDTKRCTALMGGGFSLADVIGDSYITSHTFDSNTALQASSSSSSYSPLLSNAESGVGGALYIDKIFSSIDINLCKFTSNAAYTSGGAVYLDSTERETSVEEQYDIFFLWVTFSDSKITGEETDVGHDVHFAAAYTGKVSSRHFKHCQSTSTEPTIYIDSLGDFSSWMRALALLPLFVILVVALAFAGFYLPLLFIVCCFCNRAGCYAYRRMDPVYIRKMQQKQAKQLEQAALDDTIPTDSPAVNTTDPHTPDE